MKRIKLAEFVQMPPNTVFTQFGPVCVKGETIGERDFRYNQISPFGYDPDPGMGEQRWGEFDDEAEFVVLEDQEVHDMIMSLASARNVHPNEM